MAQKKRDSESFNVATAIGPQQVIVVDFKFVSHLTQAMSDLIYRGDHTEARRFLETLISSLENQATPQTDEE